MVRMLPDHEKFPYTVRIVSEVLESNGSSSMASVCGATLSMMDCGVPLRKPVAGIAMGLIKEGERIAVLSDILGDEDHLGDMDFKVAGTEVGVTSLQMDIKIAGITEAIMDQALNQAREGRLHILREMAKGLSGARPELRESAPRINIIHIPQDKIGTVIGPGGKVIREICETTGTKIDIEDDGTVKVASNDALASQRAVDWIRGLTSEPEVGVIYTGTVVRVVDFGAFVRFLGGQDGLLHISELRNERVGKVTDVVKEGDAVKVKVLSVDDRGKIKLSMRGIDQVTGEETEPAEPRRPAGPAGEGHEGHGERPRRDRGPRRHRRAG
jgi:polyribonucleotide nucleotidyltransferase